MWSADETVFVFGERSPSHKDKQVKRRGRSQPISLMRSGENHHI
jgi:hypothetical protein